MVEIIVNSGDFLPGSLLFVEQYRGEGVTRKVTKEIQGQTVTYDEIDEDGLADVIPFTGFIVSGEKEKEKIPLSNLQNIQIITEKEKPALSGCLFIVVLILLFPISLLFLFLKGKKEIVFSTVLKDGRKLVATVDQDVFVKIKAGSL